MLSLFWLTFYTPYCLYLIYFLPSRLLFPKASASLDSAISSHGMQNTTAADQVTVYKLKDWVERNEQALNEDRAGNHKQETISLIKDLRANGMYYNVCVQVLAVHQLPFRHHLVLTVWDGTRPCCNSFVQYLYPGDLV